MALSSRKQSGAGGKHFAGASGSSTQEGGTRRPAPHRPQEARRSNARQVVADDGAPAAQPVPASVATNDAFDESAPQPIDAESTNSFRRIGSDEGAIMGEDAVSQQEQTDGDDADDQPGHRFVVVIAIAVVVVIAAGFYLFANSCSSSQPQQQEQQTTTEQTQSDAQDSIEYRGATYSLGTADDGKYVLRQTNESDGTQSVDLGELDGTPAKLVLYNGAFIIPESKADGTWDVMAYTIGSGWGPVCDHDGNAYGGQGTITDAQLDGSNLNLTVDGSQQTIALE